MKMSKCKTIKLTDEMLEGKLCVLGLEDSFSDPILKAKHMKEKKTIKLLHH